MERLRLFLRIEAAVFLAFAIGWSFAPGFVNDSILGWETETFWPRVMGFGFFGLAWGSWRTAGLLRERMDLVWVFALVPLGYLIAMVWEKVADDYVGSDRFWWVTAAITAFFGVGTLLLRLGVEPAKDMERERELVGSR